MTEKTNFATGVNFDLLYFVVSTNIITNKRT